MSTQGDCNKCKCMVCEEICGQISQECGSCGFIWQAIGVSPSITFQVTNTSNCLMEFKIERKAKEDECCIVKLRPKEETTLTVTCIKSIKVKCHTTYDESICTGRYSMCIHYPCKTECNDRKKCGKYNRCDWVCRDR